jgi:hypothetical protein
MFFCKCAIGKPADGTFVLMRKLQECMAESLIIIIFNLTTNH